jgi:hypothetical protein
MLKKLMELVTSLGQRNGFHIFKRIEINLICQKQLYMKPSELYRELAVPKSSSFQMPNCA